MMPNITPGSLVSFIGRDGVVRTDVWPANPPLYPPLSRHQRIMRRLTPKRWRKPLRPIDDPMARALRTITGIAVAVERLTNPRPWWKFWV